MTLQRLSASLADRYLLERELGAGGMATVYLAQDLKHDRKVAIKVLRPELAAVIGAERFLSEIKTTANLQHPHILALHDSGEADGFLYYVMPYIEGESLRDRLTHERQLPVDEAIRIATEVAGALDYAHRHHVIHRDIKPENILLHDSSALVADFGIALAVSTAGGGRMTETGMSLGTPHYMSPEQAMGEREITAKSDVYALGCVLYEMLCGEPPFTGPTAQAIMARVMTEEPRSLTMQRRTIPPHIEAAVHVSLSKLPADRFATAAEFAEALGGKMASRHDGRTVARTAAHLPSYRLANWRSRATAAGALILAAVGGAAIWSWIHRPVVVAPRPVARFSIQLPRDAQATGATGSTIALSPDGAEIVYRGRAPSGSQLYVRRMDRPDPVPIPGTDGGSLPFFSPDGITLGFRQGSKLVKVPVAGGPVTPIVDFPGVVYGATWTTGDTIIFGADTGLMEVAAAGGTARLIARPDSGELFHFPEVLPDGKAVLFGIVGGGTLKLAALTRRTGAIKRFSQQGGYPRYVAGGFVVVVDPAGIITALRFDAAKLEVTGAGGTLTDGMGANVDGDVNFGVSRDGDFAFQTAPTQGSRLVLVDRLGAVRAAGADSGYFFFPRFSPDGHRVALTRATDINNNKSDVWVFDLQQHTLTRVTFDTANWAPIWSPDGRHIAYANFSKGLAVPEDKIYSTSADGSGTPELLLDRRGLWVPAAFARDGRGLLTHGFALGGSKVEIWRNTLGPDSASTQLVANAFNNDGPTLSPDGHWFAYRSAESGRSEIYVRPYPGPGGRWQVSLDGGSQPVWSGTGREIFYRNGDKMMAATVRTQGSFAVGERVQLFTGTFNQGFFGARGYDVSTDGETFLMLQPIVGAAQDLIVTLNWFDNLPRTH